MRQLLTFSRLALAVLTLAAVTGCASHPKHAPAPAPAKGPAEAYTAPPAPQGGVTSRSQAPLPGSEQDFVINAGDRIYFDLDQYAVRPDAAPVLTAQAAWLNRYPAVRIRIEGNCDDRGTREYNFALGARRAQSVRDFLVSHGVDPARIAVISYGKERPMDPGSGEEAWAHNRNAHTTLLSGAR
ncbi:MAG TPA: peptidoglycan-associated lipoprotein Pal [Caulobacteraceae bacterium]